MQSSELRWTFRDQEVATEERGATVSKWKLLGHPPKKANCAFGGGGGPGGSRVFVEGEILEIVEKKILKIDIFQGTSGVRPCHRVQIPAAVPSKLGFFRVTGGLLGL
jgi:hypothetical protein